MHFCLHPNISRDLNAMTSFEDIVVKVILDTYSSLPKKSKPRQLDSKGIGEWVPLSGIAICRGESLPPTIHAQLYRCTRVGRRQRRMCGTWVLSMI